MALRLLLGIAAGLLVTWLILLVVLVRLRPRGALGAEALRLLPDTLRFKVGLRLIRSRPRSRSTLQRLSRS